MVGLSALQQLYAKAEDLCRNGDEVKAADLINKQGQILWDQAEAALEALDLPT
jgi:HPt (histidine-containing phosphotransfer) domain-containing protein